MTEFKRYPFIVSVNLVEEAIKAQLSYGRVVAIPIACFKRLSDASPKQLSNFSISPSGYGIRWPDLDEDISVKAFIDNLGSGKSL